MYILPIFYFYLAKYNDTNAANRLHHSRHVATPASNAGLAIRLLRLIALCPGKILPSNFYLFIVFITSNYQIIIS